MKTLFKTGLVALFCSALAVLPAMGTEQRHGDRQKTERKEHTVRNNSSRKDYVRKSIGDKSSDQNRTYRRQDGFRPGNNGNRPGNGSSVNNGSNNNRPGGSGFRPGATGGHRPGSGTNKPNPGVNKPNNGHKPGHGLKPGHGNHRPGNNWHFGGNNHKHPSGHRPPHMRPPHRPHRPAPSPWHRPVPPPSWRPAPGVPVIAGILGLTFGTAINVSVNYLLGNGYSVDGYGDNMVYLRNIPMLNLMWPDATLYYAPTGGLIGSQFVYSTPYYDTLRYNMTYNNLISVYGMPVSVSNGSAGMSAAWFTGGNGYVTLNLQSMTAMDGTMRFFTTLSFGN